MWLDNQLIATNKESYLGSFLITGTPLSGPVFF